MIKVSGMPFQPTGSLNLGTIEEEIIQSMNEARVLYSYSSLNELRFELNTRTNIIDSAKDMSEGGAEFTTFQYAICNPEYWSLTNEGGFQLRADVSPAGAVQDIYRNSSQYAFECATACVIILYHATLNSIRKPSFNSLFRNLYLYSWHTDPDLGLYTFYGDHYLPGDVVYFNNPDYSQENPWYRGINAVALDGGMFFGHGLGLMNAEQIIEFLNGTRKPGSNQPAYLTRLISRPSFNSLSALSTMQRERPVDKEPSFIIHHNMSSISFVKYLSYLL
ncbi:protein-glutamine gamma-glutamyltransferase [Bacillus sp. AK031]